MIKFFIRGFAGFALIAVALSSMAAEPAAKSEAASTVPPAASGPKADTPATPVISDQDSTLLELPKIEVTAQRVKQLDREIKRLDKAIKREKKNVKATDLDKVLNNSKAANAAALFGGNSAAYMEQVAATRVRYMETERALLVELRAPRTLEDFNLLNGELEKIRTMQRELDNPRR